MEQHGKYLIPIASKMLDVLELFRSPADEWTLEQVTARTGIAHTTTYRILFTLVHRRYLAQHGKKYRLNLVRRKTRIGFATLTRELPFAEAVQASLQQAAVAAGLELLLYDNQRNAKVAIENAKAMVADKVDVAIEFQRYEEAAPVIADILGMAGIPAIAIHIPQPGATYFGIDNFRAGYSAGLALAAHAKEFWSGHFDTLLLLDVPQGGVVLQSRMTGVRKAVEDTLGPIAGSKVARLDGGAVRERARAVTEKWLRQHPEARRLLVSATSDEGALGARQAIQSTRKNINAAVVGMEGTEEALAAIAEPGSPFIGTVEFFPEEYGLGLVGLVLRLLRGEQVPPFQYSRHELIARTERLPSLIRSQHQ